MYTLYKKDSKGKMRVWKAYTEGTSLIQEYGLVDGKQASSSKECKPKNIGRANETTGPEQAKLELESKVLSKRDEGYVDTIDEAQSQTIILPMLAQPYKKASKYIDWDGDVFVQRKYDGIRCLAIVKNGEVTLISRTNKLITTMSHIQEGIMKRFPDGIYDGELFIEGAPFQVITSLVSKEQEESKQVALYVYDMISDNWFAARYDALRSIVENTQSQYWDDWTCVLVPTYSIISEDEIVEYQKQFVEEWYEGTIVRWGDFGYQIDSRHKSLIKYKEFIDEMFELIDIIPSDARPDQWIAVMVTKEWAEFKGAFKLTHEERQERLENKEKYIWKMVECRFFEYTTSTPPIPRFPSVIGERIDK